MPRREPDNAKIVEAEPPAETEHYCQPSDLTLFNAALRLWKCKVCGQAVSIARVNLPRLADILSNMMPRRRRRR